MKTKTRTTALAAYVQQSEHHAFVVVETSPTVRYYTRYLSIEGADQLLSRIAVKGSIDTSLPIWSKYINEEEQDASLESNELPAH